MIIPNRCKCGKTIDNGVGVQERTIMSLIIPRTQYRLACHSCGRVSWWCDGIEETIKDWNNRCSKKGGAK